MQKSRYSNSNYMRRYTADFQLRIDVVVLWKYVVRDDWMFFTVF